MTPKINPRCKQDMAQIYVSAEGIIMPCCWMGNVPHMNRYLEFHKENLDELSLENKNVDDIVNGENFKKIEETWETDQPFSVCQKFCSKKNVNIDEQQGTNRTLKKLVL